MQTRRQLLSLSIAALCGPLIQPALGQSPKPSTAPNASDPLAIMNAIYTRVTAGKGDEGGNFVLLKHRDRQRYLSKSLTTLWKKADDNTPKGDQNPPGFDPITNSQDPLVKSFKASVEKQDDKSATIVVVMKSGHSGPPRPLVDDTVRFDFVRDGTSWKIDDIRGRTDRNTWSIRHILTESLKY